MTRGARGAGHLVAGLLLLWPVLRDGLISVTRVVAVLRSISHGLLVLPWTSDRLHRLHGDSVGHVRRARLLRTGLWVSMELLVWWGLRADSRSLSLVCGRRTLRLKWSGTRKVRSS